MLEQPLKQTSISRDEPLSLTWGLTHVGVSGTKFTGQGVKVAILDTGCNLDHADFSNRNVIAKSFVANESAHDGNGHGTHCAGIVLGSCTPQRGPRYGVAYGADIYIAKVLPDAGIANTRYVLQGIEWALDNQCRIISISLGNRVRYGESHSPAYEQLAQHALKQGSLIIAPAGNDSYRDIDRLLPVSHPANCPSILAVGAVDMQNKLYDRSNRSINPGGGNVGLVAPGVSIHSAWSSPEHYKTLDGTSMASSFVAGIAALWIEANPGISPIALKQKLLSTAIPLDLPQEDGGAGLVQAPTGPDISQRQVQC